jgi:hypothetical protein
LPPLVGGIELREHFARSDPVAEPHAPLNDFPRDPE